MVWLDSVSSFFPFTHAMRLVPAIITTDSAHTAPQFSVLWPGETMRTPAQEIRLRATHHSATRVGLGKRTFVCICKVSGSCGMTVRHQTGERRAAEGVSSRRPSSMRSGLLKRT